MQHLSTRTIRIHQSENSLCPLGRKQVTESVLPSFTILRFDILMLSWNDAERNGQGKVALWAADCFRRSLLATLLRSISLCGSLNSADDVCCPSSPPSLSFALCLSSYPSFAYNHHCCSSFVLIRSSSSSRNLFALWFARLSILVLSCLQSALLFSTLVFALCFHRCSFTRGII